MADAILAQSGIYSLQNLETLKRYVGSSADVRRRKRQHLGLLRGNNHTNYKLQGDWNLFGEDCFSFELLEAVPNREDLLVREQFWMNRFESATADGYNIAMFAGGAHGFPTPQEVRDKISASLKGRPFTEDRKARIKAARQLQIMKPMSEETKKKIGDAHRGRKHSEEFKRAISARQIGRRLTPEAIAKTTAANTGRKHSPERRAKFSEASKAREAKKRDLKWALSATQVPLF